MREVGVEELVEGSDDLVLQHFVDRRRVRRAFVGEQAGGGAVVVEQVARGFGGPLVVALGPLEALRTLLEEVRPHLCRPRRVIVDAAAAVAVPVAWTIDGPRAWYWMTATELPPEAGADNGGGHRVEQLTSYAEIDALLDEAFPGSHTRPVDAAAECWLGVHDEGRLVAAGALTRRGSGAGHLGGIATLTSYAGRGLGTAVTAALTRRALASGPGVASLGVYTDNAVAIGVYRRLGYEVARTLVSGPVGTRPTAPGAADPG